MSAIVEKRGRDLPSTFGARLHAARLKAGLTGCELSRRAAVSRSMISELEHGKRQPGLALACRLADALQISLLLFTGELP